MEALLAALSERVETIHRNIEKAIDGLPAEALDWVPGPDMNSIAVLLAHTVGAERYWIGDLAGDDPSGRVRAPGGDGRARAQARREDVAVPGQPHHGAAT